MRPIIPWLEIGKPRPDETWDDVLNPVRKGLAHWKRIADQWVLSTEVQWLEEVFSSPQLKNLNGIIPGIKISSVSGKHGLDSPETWQAIARAVRDVRRMTGNSTMWLDFESARKAYLGPVEKLDAWFALKSMKREIERWMLPYVEYIIYPSVWGAEVSRSHQCQFVSCVASALHTVAFASMEVNRPNDLNNEGARAAANSQLNCLEAMYRFCRWRRQMIYVCGGSTSNKYHHYGRDADPERHFIRAVDALRDTEVGVIYPGVAGWADSEIIVRDLLEHAALKATEGLGDVDS